MVKPQDRDSGASAGHRHCHVSPGCERWVLPVNGHHGRSQLVLNKDRHGHHKAALVKARGQEGTVLGATAFVHTELVVVPGPAAGCQKDVHQRALRVLRVSPACKTNPNRGSDGTRARRGRSHHPEAQPDRQSWHCLAVPLPSPGVPTMISPWHGTCPRCCPQQGVTPLWQRDRLSPQRGQLEDSTGLEGSIRSLQCKALTLFVFF